MQPPIRILILDDHTLFRQSLVRLLADEPDLNVVAQASCVDDAGEWLAKHPADIILLDHDLGEGSGTEVLGQIAPEQRPLVLMVTAGIEPRALLNAMDLGVRGVILKHSDPGLLMTAIRRVAAGETWWDSALLRATGLAALSGAPSRPRIANTLTERQQVILRGIFDGLSNKEIAAQLSASETSVKAVIQELFNKTGVKTRSQLVRVAIERYDLSASSEL